MAKGGRFFDVAARGNLLAAWGERFVRLGAALGINSWAQALVGASIAAAYPAMSHFIGLWSWWIAIPVGLVVATYALKFYAAFKAALAIRGIKTLDIQQVGKDCVTFRTDVMEFLVGRLDAAPSRFVSARLTEAPAIEAARREWAKNVDYNNQTRARVIQKFAHRAVTICHLLERTAIKPPSLWGFDHNAADIAAYVGAIGDLLERGLLKDARAMDPEELRRMMLHMG